MKFVITLMVRDEVDIIAAMVEHHLAQGADLIIATDNGSVDGTAEILKEYADKGLVELHHDPEHRKQQHALVSRMARRAFTVHGADWVINADADEFFVPVDRSLTLREALENIPTSIDAFEARVFNMVGAPAERGSGIDRLIYRDERSDAALNAAGLLGHPTSDAIHKGDPTVEVAQGNHFVSLVSKGEPDPRYAIEVYHLPWRSWEQLERKVVNTGRSYENNPHLKPSPNHHGMADYRRYLGGRLRYTYYLRLPLLDELESGGVDGGCPKDTWLSEHLHGLVASAYLPERLAACLDPADDEVVSAADQREGARLGALLRTVESERDEIAHELTTTRRELGLVTKERDRYRRLSMPVWVPVRVLRKAVRFVADQRSRRAGARAGGATRG